MVVSSTQPVPREEKGSITTPSPPSAVMAWIDGVPHAIFVLLVVDIVAVVILVSMALNPGHHLRTVTPIPPLSESELDGPAAPGG